MYNKTCSIFACIIYILVLVSCNQTYNNNRTFDSSGDTFIVNINDSSDIYTKISIEENVKYEGTLETNQKCSFSSILKSPKAQEYSYEIAYLLAQHNGDIKMNINIDNVIDTTVNIHLDIIKDFEYSSNVEEGICANLSGKFDSINVESNIIKWLFRKNIKNVGDETIKKMRLYLQELNRTKFKEYITKDSIPVITSFKDINYKISSNLVADNYYLFACNKEEDIDEFIEEMASIKFEGATHSLSQTLSCYRDPSSFGALCIFLIGIDNDWNYRLTPVGLISIDNINPTNKMSDNPIKSESEEFIFKKNRFKIHTLETPIIEGFALLNTKNWTGNFISSNVIFEIHFAGDVKNLTLIREGNLAKWHSKGQKNIDLQSEKSPYIFTYELHLEDGDNFVPVILTDLRGNKTEFKFNVGCQIIKDNKPQINIENEVNIFD